MKTVYLDERRLPLVIEAEEGDDEETRREALRTLCRRERAFLQDGLKEAGALLFRGYGRIDEEGLTEFARLFSGGELWDYVGGASPRTKLSGRVYTSTEYPPHYTLSLHNELSYSYRWPRQLYFCCVTPAAHGGETSIGDSRRLLAHISPDVVREFKERGIRYVRNLHGGEGTGLSWQSAFETADRDAVEEYCRAGGMSFKWKEDGGLRTCLTRPATLVHPETGAEVWFNQADGFHPSGMDRAVYESLIERMAEEDFPLHVTFGDGSRIPLAYLEHIRAVMWQQTVLFPWQVGDILVVDNILTAHGRMPFTGERKILLAMT